jgi:hypothetical protein
VGVTSSSVEESLDRAEVSVSSGEGLSGTGFWSAVSTVKQNPELVDRYADRIAEIDERGFRQWALLVVPLWLGTVLMLLATAGAIALVGWAYFLEGLAAVAAFYVGFGALLVTTHGLGHLLVGSLVGIRFLYWFMGPPSFPLTGGVKIDYRTYLRAPARARAWMHAAGAITTKIVPFALIGAAIAAELPAWAIWGLAIIGAAAVLTDVVWSTKKSDWKKFRREMSFAQGS